MSNRPGRKMARAQARRRPPALADRPSWMNPAVLVGIGLVVIVALAAVIAFAITGDEDETTPVASGPQVAPFDDLVIEGTSLPQMPENAADAALGLAAPAFSTISFDGQSVRLAPADGTTRLIGFFAHWCPHCQAELPRVVDYLGSTGLPDGVEVVAVSTSATADLGNYPPSAWFAAEQWPGVVLLDDEFGRIADAYGLRNYPMWVVVSPEGTVIERNSGEMSTADFDAMVQRAVAS